MEDVINFLRYNPSLWEEGLFDTAVQGSYSHHTVFKSNILKVEHYPDKSYCLVTALDGSDISTVLNYKECENFCAALDELWYS